jgi:hypothetical protein
MSFEIFKVCVHLEVIISVCLFRREGLKNLKKKTRKRIDQCR